MRFLTRFAPWTFRSALYVLFLDKDKDCQVRGGFPLSETISSVLRYSAAGVPPPGLGGSLPESGEWPSPYGVHASPPKRRSGVGKYWF